MAARRLPLHIVTCFIDVGICGDEVVYHGQCWFFKCLDKLERQQTLADERIGLVLYKIEAMSPAVTMEQLFSFDSVKGAYTFVCELGHSAEKSPLYHYHDGFLTADGVGATIINEGKPGEIITL